MSSIRKFMAYAAAPVSFHVFSLSVALSQLMLVRAYGSEGCAVPLCVFHLVSGMHGLVCAFIGLLEAKAKMMREKEEEMLREKLGRERPVEPLAISDKMDVDMRFSTSMASSHNSQSSGNMESSKRSTSLYGEKAKKKKGKTGKNKNEDKTSEKLALVGDCAVKFMDWLFRFAWLVAGSTWVRSASTNICQSELFWGSYVFIIIGWMNTLVTVVATATSLVVAYNSSEK